MSTDDLPDIPDDALDLVDTVSEPPKNKAIKESLSIPVSVRAIVDERDGYHCRVCGKYLGPESRAHHHIVYGGDERGFGGRRVHNPDEIITVCWMWAGNCHDLVHGNKNLWQPLLLRTAARRGITARQLKRWDEARSRRASRPQRPFKEQT